MYRSRKKTSLSANDLDVLIQKMADNWPSEVVARTKIEEFTGGMQALLSAIRGLVRKAKKGTQR
jgi:hypothetical protein